MEEFISMKTLYVFCTTQFEFLHRWPEAEKPVEYLSYLHRHMFHVKVMVKVTHHNRDVEFITLKNNVDEFIRTHKPAWGTTMSCEDMCERIGIDLLNQGIKVALVEVSEDGENGAVVTYE
jgi:type III secretory pathway component EscV